MCIRHPCGTSGDIQARVLSLVRAPTNRPPTWCTILDATTASEPLFIGIYHVCKYQPMSPLLHHRLPLRRIRAEMVHQNPSWAVWDFKTRKRLGWNPTSSSEDGQLRTCPPILGPGANFRHSSRLCFLATLRFQTFRSWTRGRCPCVCSAAARIALTSTVYPSSLSSPHSPALSSGFNGHRKTPPTRLGKLYILLPPFFQTLWDIDVRFSKRSITYPTLPALFYLYLFTSLLGYSYVRDGPAYVPPVCFLQLSTHLIFLPQLTYTY